MTVQFTMTWVSSGRRWVKKNGKTTVAVSCRQLERLYPEIFRGPTKNESAAAANRWLQERAKAAQSEDQYLIPTGMLGGVPADPIVSKQVSEIIADHGNRERCRLLGRPINPKKSVQALGKLYLEYRQADVAGGNLAAIALPNIRSRLKKFLTWIPSDDPKDLTGACLAAYRAHLQTLGLSSVTAATSMKAAIYFVRWCASIMDAMPLPEAAREGSTALKMRAVGKRPIPFTDEQITKLFKAAKGIDRLFYLLMLNTGCTQGDIGKLLKTSVDLDKGYVTIRRNKTKDHGAVPTVTYRLWPETLALLKEHWSKHPLYVFYDFKHDQRMDHKNKIGRHYADFYQDDLGLLPLKCLRKTVTEKLHQHHEHARIAQYFLGHAANLMITRFYKPDPTQAEVDAACDWLRQQWTI